MTKTLHCETDFPRALKDNMKSLGFEGEELDAFKKEIDETTPLATLLEQRST